MSSLALGMELKAGRIYLLALPVAFQAFLAPSRSAVARRAQEQDGPVGDWVECEISYTPRISAHHTRVEPRRSDARSPKFHGFWMLFLPSFA